jgi:hypothetical protein
VKGEKQSREYRKLAGGMLRQEFSTLRGFAGCVASGFSACSGGLVLNRPDLNHRGHVMRRGVLATFACIFAALLLSGCGSQPPLGPLHSDAWLSYKFGPGCGAYPGTCTDPNGLPSLTDTAETELYYQNIGGTDPLNINIKKTFTQWQAEYGYWTNGAGTALNPNIVSAYYGNKLDLQFGRFMQCWNAVITSRDAVGPIIACYVTNYGQAPLLSDNQTVNPAWPNLTQAVDDAINHTNTIATVAMVYSQGGVGINGDPVAFYVFDKTGALSDNAILDQEGSKTVPRICMACHGGTYNATTHSVQAPSGGQLGASFLPFDVWSLYYSPDIPGYSRDNQQESFRQLNNLVLQTNPSPAIQGLINDLYSKNVAVKGTTIPDDSYVPASWQTADGSGQIIYKGVYRQYCRMCHLAEPAPPDFSSFANLQNGNDPALISTFVCLSYRQDMPHAQVPFGGVQGIGFWNDATAIYDLNKIAIPASCPVFPGQ